MRTFSLMMASSGITVSNLRTAITKRYNPLVKKYKPRWFQLAATAGVALAVLLFIETTLTYRYTTSRIGRDQGFLQATEDASSLEHWLRRERVDTADRLQQVLAQMADDRSDEIAWMTVIDANGQVRASSGRFTGTRPVPAPERIRAALERAERSTEVHETSGGQILIALLPIRPRFQSQATPGGPADWRVLEIAIYYARPPGRATPTASQSADLRNRGDFSHDSDGRSPDPAEDVCPHKDAGGPTSTGKSCPTAAVA